MLAHSYFFIEKIRVLKKDYYDSIDLMSTDSPFNFICFFWRKTDNCEQ